MPFRDVFMNSPRNPGYLIKVRMPDDFTDYRRVDDIAMLAVEIMNHTVSFVSYPLNSTGLVAVHLALAEAIDEEEINRGVSMMQAIMAYRVPTMQPSISYQALTLLREKYPDFVYNVYTSRQA